jgi:hypothetical protein
MPIKSKSQQRFMGLIASGRLKKPGLSKEKAKEFFKETKSFKTLPEKAKKKY